MAHNERSPTHLERCMGLSQLGFIASHRGDYLSSVLTLVFVQIDTLEACSRQRLRCGVQITLYIHLRLTYEGLM